MVERVVATLMSAEADALCGAAGARQPDRTNRRNDYRERGWDTDQGRDLAPAEAAELRQLGD